MYTPRQTPSTPTNCNGVSTSPSRTSYTRHWREKRQRRDPSGGISLQKPRERDEAEGSGNEPKIQNRGGGSTGKRK
jgi:hypothetical protein